MRCPWDSRAACTAASFETFTCYCCSMILVWCICGVATKLCGGNTESVRCVVWCSCPWYLAVLDCVHWKFYLYVYVYLWYCHHRTFAWYDVLRVIECFGWLFPQRFFGGSRWLVLAIVLVCTSLVKTDPLSKARLTSCFHDERILRLIPGSATGREISTWSTFAQGEVPSYQNSQVRTCS